MLEAEEYEIMQECPICFGLKELAGYVCDNCDEDGLVIHECEEES